MKVIMQMAVSLDGFIAKSNGDSDWVTEEDSSLFDEAVGKAGCVIVGKNTFEQYKGEIFPVPNAKNYVLTTEKHENDTPAVMYLSGTEELMNNLERDGFQEVILAGGGETNGRLGQADLIDEAVLSIYPIILGAGIRLFGSWAGKLNLELIETNNLGKGVTQNHYRVIK